MLWLTGLGGPWENGGGGVVITSWEQLLIVPTEIRRNGFIH